MSSRESTYDSTSAVILIILLVFSLLNDPVIGEPLLLLGFQEEEESPSFQSTDRDGICLMEEYDDTFLNCIFVIHNNIKFYCILLLGIIN